METTGNRPKKADDDDEILSQNWDEEITVNKRLPVQIWNSVN